MSGFDDWICDHEGEVYEKFKVKFKSQIQDEYDTKFKDSYPDFEEFLDNEMCYITDTLLETEWIGFIDDEHVAFISSAADAAFDREKDRIAESYETKN